jgi:hypothetical protein
VGDAGSREQGALISFFLFLASFQDPMPYFSHHLEGPAHALFSQDELHIGVRWADPEPEK